MPDPTPSPPASDQPTVPVAEALRYQQRAREAQQQLEALGAEQAQLRQQLDESRQTIASLERRQKIDQLLAESDTVDLAAARLLTEAAVADMDEPDLQLAVQDLRRSKPYLFHAAPRLSTLAPALDPPHTAPEEDAAARAAQTGDRRDLLTYLRLRRKA